MLALAMTGRIDKQIAAEMGISLGTVRVYWKRIRQKVGGTRSEVIAELARNSLKLDFDNVADRADQLQRELEASMARERELRVFEAAFESIPTALAILDGPDGKLVRVNPAFAKVHGYEADELEDAPAPSLMKPEEAEAFVRRAKIAENDGKFLDVSGTRLRKDGTTFPARIVLSGKGGAWVLAVTP